MSGIDSARRTEALDHVSQALTLVEKVQIRWRRFADTAPLADSVEPVAIILRTTKNILSRSTEAHPADAGAILKDVMAAMQKMKRDELRAAIDKTTAAYDALVKRPERTPI